MKDDCMFCKIVRGEIPSDKVWEDDSVFVFLDAFPSVKGQTLVIPKKHLAPWLFDLNDEIYCKLMLVAKKIAKAINKALNPIKTGLVVEGLEVEHVHIKLFPLDGPFHFKPLDPKPSEKEMKEIAKKIKSFLD